MSEWERVLYAMKTRGLQISPNEEKELFYILREKKLIIE